MTILAIKLYTYNTVNSEIFARILFSQKALKDIFAALKICDYDMIYVHYKTTKVIAMLQGFYFHGTSQMRSFAKIKTPAKILA